ncbi:FAD-dependent oxidoreductase [Halomonas sp. 707B3]|uniref:FAD-dependent oxidoreductase n=1 Tax=Halomonas sp. 707B3 TaxID=1681043 RepID=UPI00209FE6C4|nr:FAD-dependent oxidoreductase [Halomonas sp. 707B3]MCP1316312.1 FAD-dependent oxidoreductase [Halomonas sp. 707B3]
MYLSFETLAAQDTVYDICIVGAGAAGIAIAVTLVQQGHRTLLCEGGEASYSERSQAIYRGDIVGDPYIPLDDARLRYLGGSTNHWGGICRPLDAHDFTAKVATPETAWPITQEALAPYYASAATLLNLTPPHADYPVTGSGFERIYFSLGDPVRLKDKYAPALHASSNVDYCLTANLVGLESHDGRVKRAKLRSFQSGECHVRARFFVLACGGIENSRLLLWLNQQSNGQLIRNATTLGRYWMEHPHASVGQALLFEPQALGLDQEYNVFLSPTPEILTKRQLLNCGLRLHRMNAEATQQLIKALSRDAPSLGEQLATWQAQGRVMHGVILRAAWEQEPRFENRVELGTEVDEFGIPHSRLVWRQSALDRHTIRESMILLGEHLLNQDIGRLQLADWLAVQPVTMPSEGELAGRHHMGGTRMSHSAEQGIVNSDCRLFDQENMFVAGSSVFPSVGHANPTLTIVQLALRLCDHLDRQLTLQPRA